jgi:pyrimidine deaminase RibD-like protein
MISSARDEELMRIAVDLSKQSRAENDGRIHPMVGAVIAHPNGQVISTGFRGRYTPGFHAEQEALVGINEDVVAGAVVYSSHVPFAANRRPAVSGLWTAASAKLLSEYSIRIQT